MFIQRAMQKKKSLQQQKFGATKTQSSRNFGGNRKTQLWARVWHAGQGMGEREVQWISNLGDMDPEKFPRAGICKKLGIKFAFGIPYYVGNNCNDVIELFSKKAAEPTDADKAFIKIITSTINS